MTIDHTASPDAAGRFSAPEKHDRLAHFPISFFAVVMGLCGFSLALRASEHALDIGAEAAFRPSLIVAGLAGAVFIAIGAIYVAKVAQRFSAVEMEWGHPVRIAFFPAISISVLLFATIVAPYSQTVAQALWLLGASAQAVLTLSVIAAWISRGPFQPMHLNPAWFIPAVGNLVAPLAGPDLGFVELSWLFFSAGLIFWIVLLTLVVNRLIFHDPMPGKLAPTLVILIAPPAVAFIAYLRLGGDIDAFARILLNAAYVFAAVVATQAPKLARLPFALSWWALSFPIAALAVASLVFAERIGSMAHEAIGLGLTAALFVAIVGLIARTAQAIKARAICQPE